MQPPAPPTQFETNTLQAYQFLSQMRMRANGLNDPVHSCVRKCLDLSELSENKRGTRQHINRLQEDEREKKCLEFCALKYEELGRKVTQHVNRREIMKMQAELIQQMQARAMDQAAMMRK
eukprot:PhM_4_TR12489/c0_g1_i1/m.33